MGIHATANLSDQRFKTAVERMCQLVSLSGVELQMLFRDVAVLLLAGSLSFLHHFRIMCSTLLISYTGFFPKYCVKADLVMLIIPHLPLSLPLIFYVCMEPSCESQGVHVHVR